MKYLASIQLLVVISVFNLKSQTAETPFVLTVDSQWHTEIIEFPLSFAPEIKFEGYEDLRFLKSWNDRNSDEFWSYGYAWILNKDPELSESNLSEKINSYYNGLMNLNSNDPEKSVQKTSSTFTKSKSSEDHYTGNIETLDAFFTKEPLKFNVQVESSYCEALQKHIVLFHLSPKSFEDEVWKQLKRIKPKCE